MENIGKKILTYADTQEEILLVDKPKGITSYDVIRQLKTLFLKNEKGFGKMPKLGHAGTLDPRATGLMIIGVGQGTKKLTAHIKLSKTYVAEIALGVRTDSGDLDGNVLEHMPLPPDLLDPVIGGEKIRKCIESMTGTLFLPVPAYSAIKKQGKKLYEYARAGEPVDLPIKEMRVDSAIFLGMNGPNIKAEFSVSSGTYIRSLAEEIGRRIGVHATLAELRRTRIGDFHIENAIQLPER